MAYLPSSKWNEQEPNGLKLGDAAPGQPTAIADPVKPTSEATSGTTQQEPAGTAATTPATPQASYPGIVSYLKANEGAGAGLAKQAKEKIGSEVTGAQDKYNTALASWQTGNADAINQWQKTYQSATEANNEAQRKYDEDLTYWNTHRPDLQTVSYNPSNAPWVQGYATNPYYQSGASAPVAPTLQDIPTAPTLSQFYAPNEVTAAAQQAKNEIDALGTDSGREALLAQNAPATGYSEGARGLDATLMGQYNPQADLTAQYGDIISALNGGTPVDPEAATTPVVKTYDPKDHNGETLSIPGTYGPGGTSYGANPLSGSGTDTWGGPGTGYGGSGTGYGGIGSAGGW